MVEEAKKPEEEINKNLNADGIAVTTSEELAKKNGSTQEDRNRVIEEENKQRKEKGEKIADAYGKSNDNIADKDIIIKEGRDMSATVIEDATNRDDKNQPLQAPKFSPRKKSKLEKTYDNIGKRFGWNSLVQFAECHTILSDPDRTPAEAGQAYANMKDLIQNVENTSAEVKIFVDSYLGDARVKVAASGHLGAISDIGYMYQDGRVPKVLSRLINNNQNRDGALVQNTTIKSYKEFFNGNLNYNSDFTVEEYVDGYSKTMASIVENSQTNENRALALNAISLLVSDGALDQKQTKIVSEAVISTLNVKSENLDRKSSYLLIDLLDRNQLTKTDQKAIETSIQAKISNDIQKEQTLLALAEYKEFTKVALEKIIAAVDKMTQTSPGLASRTFEEGLNNVSSFFQDNKDLVDSKKITLEKLYKNAIPESFKENKNWRDMVGAADLKVNKLKSPQQGGGTPA